MSAQDHIKEAAIAAGWTEAGASAAADTLSLLLEVEVYPDIGSAVFSLRQAILSGRLGWDEVRALNEHAPLITHALEAALGVPHPRAMREAVGDGIAFTEALAIRACALVLSDKPDYFEWARKRRAAHNAALNLKKQIGALVGKVAGAYR